MLAVPRRCLPFLFALALLTACGGVPIAQPTAAPAPTEAPAPTAAAAAPTSAPAAAGYPVTVENCGRTLTFEQAPERAVTLYPPTTEMMLALGLKDRIVAAGFSDGETISPELETDYRTLNFISETGGPSREVLLAQQPDFVFDNQPDYFYDSSQGFATQDDLRSAGAQVYSLHMNCPDKTSPVAVEDIFIDIRNIGAIFGVPERAEALIAEMEQQIAATKERIAGQPPLRVLVYDAGEGPLNVFGSNSSRYAVFKALGIENIFGELPDGGYGPVSIEEVAAREADAFVVLGYSFPGVATSEERAAFLTRTFPNNPAVQGGRVVIFPYGYMNPSVQNARGVEELARLLYPDAFDAAATAPAASSYPVTIENCGNTLTFEQAPERVAALYPPVTEMLLLLGLKERIVGAGGSGTEPVLPEFQADFEALPKLGEGFQIPREVLLAAEPDLVMDNQPDYFYDASQGFATREEIAAAGAQIYSLTAKCGGGKLDATMEDVYTDLRNIGAIFGVPERAEAEIAKMEQRIAAVTEKLEGVEPVSVIYYDAGEGPLGIFGPGTWEYVFELAGATNAFSDLSESYAQLSVEEVATRDADFIVVAGYESGDKTSEERAAFIRATFPNTQAVQNDRVIIIPYEYTNPGIQNVLGVETLARALHPERFE